MDNNRFAQLFNLQNLGEFVIRCRNLLSNQLTFGNGFSVAHHTYRYTITVLLQVLDDIHFHISPYIVTTNSETLDAMPNAP